MDHPVAEPVEFVFLWWPDSEYGVVLSRDDYRLVDRFHLARQTAHTWDEFLEQFGDYTHWLDDFMQFDETKPRGEDLLADLEDSLWVLGNDEFPLTQCVEESFGHYGSLFPKCDDAVTIGPNMACRYACIRRPLASPSKTIWRRRDTRCRM